mmetsp:Transcript_21149/g.54936  ORF Transcript_21149/g.54936 Transcript_21149/m.54936 type:complete len:117 (+) Transcript_21149:1143-1493(+)
MSTRRSTRASGDDDNMTTSGRPVTLKQVSRSLEKRQNEIDSQSVRVTRTSLCRRPKSRKHHGDARVQNMRGRACPDAAAECRRERNGRAEDRGHGEGLARERGLSHNRLKCRRRGA